MLGFPISEKKNVRIEDRRVFAVIISLVLMLSCLIPVGCKKTEDHFPTIPSSENSSETVPQSSATSFPTQTLEMTIASPLSYETCQYLAKLYYAKSNGLLGEGVTGDTVDLEYLDSINLPYVLNVYGTADTGCNVDTLKQWKEDGTLPDIFLADEFDAIVSSGYAKPITDYLSNNQLFSADRTYSGMITSFFVNQEQYGIPYQSSAAVLFCDMEVLEMAGIPAVSYQQSKRSLETILETISLLNADEQVVLPFYMAQNMIPYLPCSLYADRYLSASSKDDRAVRAYSDSLNYVKGLIGKGYCYESLSEENIEKLFEGMSPLLSRKVGVWAGTTDELPRFDNYMPNTLALMQYPSIEDDTYSPPLLVSYPLCVSSACEHPKEACELAAFFALDEDALLLTSRLQPREGYVPSISAPSVWKSVMARLKYGPYLIQYLDLMNQAVYIPVVSGSQAFQQDLDYITDEVQPILVQEREEQSD